SHRAWWHRCAAASRVRASLSQRARPRPASTSSPSCVGRADMVAGLAPGFADPVLAAQSTFRRIMDAAARPGLGCSLAETVNPPPPLARGAGAVALTLFDQDTPVWLDAALDTEPEVAYWLRFHTRAPIVAEPDRAAFAILSDAERMPALE